MAKKNNTTVSVEAGSVMDVATTEYVATAQRFEAEALPQLVLIVTGAVAQGVSVRGFADTVAKKSTGAGFCSKSTVSRLANTGELADVARVSRGSFIDIYRALNKRSKADVLAICEEVATVDKGRAKVLADRLAELMQAPTAEAEADTAEAEAEEAEADTEAEAPASVKADRLIDRLRDTLADLENLELNEAQRDRVSDMLATFSAVFAD